MSLIEQVEKSRSFSNFVHEAMDNMPLLSNLRNITASGCLTLSLEHYSSIVLLLGGLGQNAGSACALLRPQFESYVRGAWIFNCASDDQVKSFREDNDPPGFGSLIKELETQDAWKGGGLSVMKSHVWTALCSYTHGGGLHVSRRIRDNEIVGNYSADDLTQILDFSNNFALLAANELFGMAGYAGLANSVHDEYKSTFQFPSLLS
jgi:hypothetical protein